MPFAGGARAKGFDRLEPRNQRSSLQPSWILLDGFEPWLLKFDGVAMTKGREICTRATGST